MLILDIERICKEKGISNASIFLRGLGFHSKYITTIMRGKSTRMDYRQLEKLCLALHCTPGDLFAWHPDEGATVASNHPMQTLVRVNKPSIQDLLRNLPAHKIDELRGLVEQMGSDAS